MWQGALAIADREGLVSPAYVVARPTAAIDPKFAGYFLKSARMLHALWAHSYGLTDDRLRLYYKDFAMIRAEVPTLPEQRRIAEILSAWEVGIEQTEKLIAAKERIKRGLMQLLLSQDPSSDRDWRTLGKLFSERIEQNRPDLRLLSITGDRGVIDREDLNKRDNSSTDKTKYLRICPGDIGYNTMRMWQGISGLSKLDGIVSPAYTVVTPGAEIDGAFAAHLFKHPRVVYEFWRHSQGLVDDTLNLKFSGFAQVRVLLPESLIEQRRIAKILDTACDELLELRALASALRRQKHGLMQVLLTGKVRVRVEEATRG
jgi:type I restriction enzyme S subunit